MYFGCSCGRFTVTQTVLVLVIRVHNILIDSCHGSARRAGEHSVPGWRRGRHGKNTRDIVALFCLEYFGQVVAARRWNTNFVVDPSLGWMDGGMIYRAAAGRRVW